MNMLVARAEMAVRPNPHTIIRDEVDFVEFTVKQYYEKIGREAQENWDFHKRMAQRLLEEM